MYIYTYMYMYIHTYINICRRFTDIFMAHCASVVYTCVCLCACVCIHTHTILCVTEFFLSRCQTRANKHLKRPKRQLGREDSTRRAAKWVVSYMMIWMSHCTQKKVMHDWVMSHTHTVGSVTLHTEYGQMSHVTHEWVRHVTHTHRNWQDRTRRVAKLAMSHLNEPGLM